MRLNSSSTEYSFTARYAATENHTASPSSTALTAATASPSSGGSSGGSTATYAPVVEQPAGGTVTVSPKAPKKGDQVTVTPKADAGKEIDKKNCTL